MKISISWHFVVAINEDDEEREQAIGFTIRHEDEEEDDEDEEYDLTRINKRSV